MALHNWTELSGVKCEQNWPVNIIFGNTTRTIATNTKTKKWEMRLKNSQLSSRVVYYRLDIMMKTTPKQLPDMPHHIGMRLMCIGPTRVDITCITGIR